MHSTSFKIALVGNPNCGKSTIFNLLTGLDQKIANFPGVTVEKKIGHCQLTNPNTKSNFNATIVDLPGTYSLYPKSPDECIPLQVLSDKHSDAHPDLVVVIADASNLKRSLLVCTQVIDLKKPTILALNMMDLAIANKIIIDIETLSEELGVPVIAMNARSEKGIKELKACMAIHKSIPGKTFISFTDYMPEVVDKIKQVVLLDNDYGVLQICNNQKYLSYFNLSPSQLLETRRILDEHNFPSHKLQAQETLQRYTNIGNSLSKAVNYPEKTALSITHKIDKWLTHRIWGFLFFFLIMFMVFQAIYSWSEYPMSWVESMFIWLGNSLKYLLPSSLITNLLVNGILAGFSGIVVFVPQIAMLFMFIAILEDTGYMARISFITDRLMRKFGLNGKSVIPLISGVACAVPAIMGTRTIQNKKERILTILVTPFMSCSARIPVYTLIIALVIPQYKLWGAFNLQGLTLMGLYLLGLVAAITSAMVLRLFIKTKDKSYFIMEMPVYRAPRWNNIALSVIEKVKVFLFETGKIIIAISMLLWALSSFGPPSKIKVIDTKYAKIKRTDTTAITQQKEQSEKLEASYAGMMGHWIEPAIKPLGFDWKIGIALVTSFAAREVFVGTMATIYNAGDEKNITSVKEKMQADINPETGKPLYTIAVGLSLMVFYAFAMQCMSTVATVYRETGHWKWPVIQIMYMSGLAYFSSMLVFQLFR